MQTLSAQVSSDILYRNTNTNVRLAIKDAIEFNAASFTVGENAMLEGLLKKMPGMEVGADGSV